MRNLPQIRSKRRNNGAIYYQIRIRGRDHYLGTQRAAARRRAAQILQDAYGQAGGDDLDRPEYVVHLIDRWELAHAEYPKPWITQAWARYAGTLALTELTADHFDGYLAWLRRGYQVDPVPHGRGSTPAREARSYASNSIRDRVSHALRICRWAADRGWLDRIPRRPRLPAPHRRPRDVSSPKLAAVFQSLPDRAGALLRFCLETGCRPAEARQLRWDQVDVSAGWCQIVEHKTAGRSGQIRTLYLSPPARDLLTRAAERAGGSQWVFPSRLGRPYTASGLRAILRRHAPGVTPYQLRHTFAQHAVDAGIDLADLAGLMGHTDLRTTRWYSEVRSTRLAAAAAGLASPLPDKPPDGPPAGGPGVSCPAPRPARRAKSARAHRRTAG